MKLTSLGHSAFVLDMDRRDGGGVARILVDPWITDACVGDLMGRFPRVRFAPGNLAPIDGVYLSHSHTDHLDPESLHTLWRGLAPKPALLLPQSLLFLRPLLAEYLPDTRFVVLEDRRPVEFRGITVTAFFNPALAATNEDDVMVLRAENGREVLLNEADAVLPFDDPEARETLASILGAPGIETACFLTTRNMLAATMSSLAASDLADRETRVADAVDRTYDEIYGMLAPPDEDLADPWTNPRLVRLVAGQGLCHPRALGGDLNRVLFPIGRADRVRMEREVAEQVGAAARIEEFVPGMVHRLSGGTLAAREPAPSLDLLDTEVDRKFDPALPLFDPFPVAPLREEARDVATARTRFGTVLNERFLPWLTGSGSPPIEHLLAASGGDYRIRFRFGTPRESRDTDFRVSFDRIRFAETEPEGDPDEFYWANDVEDFLAGRADEFSVYPRKPLPGRSLRLWNCLGMPFLNQDLVERKLRLHFERAAAGLTNESWVLPFHR